MTYRYAGGATRRRLGLFLAGATACAIAGCQTMTVKLPDINNPVLLGERLHVGDTPTFATSATGEHYEGVHKHDQTVASSKYSTSTRDEWVRNAQPNAQWAFQGTVRRAVRDTTVVASAWVANFFIAIRTHEDVALRGEVVTVDPLTDDLAKFPDDAPGAPPADAAKPSIAAGGES